MKYIYTLLSMAIVSFVIISINPQKGHSLSSGAPAGRTGASNEGSCADAGCHGGTLTFEANAITSTVPMGGYKPGDTYDITVTVSEMGKARFGFQAKATAGTLATSDNETQLVGGGNYVTHTSGSTVVNNTKSWTFEWTAPAAGTGTVTLNAAMLAANNNGSSSGDNTYGSFLEIEEASNTAVKDFSTAGMSIYPVPFTNSITLEKGTQTFETANVAIYTLTGKKVAEQQMSSTSISFDTEGLAKGIYIVRLSTGSININQKVAKF